MKSLSLPALLLAVVLATPACTYLEQASTGPPPVTWAGAVPPQETRSAPDTTDFAEPAETETPPALATPAPDPLPQEAVEPEMEPEPDVFAEAPAEEEKATPEEPEAEEHPSLPFNDPFEERPPLDPVQPEEHVVTVEATDTEVADAPIEDEFPEVESSEVESSEAESPETESPEAESSGDVAEPASAPTSGGPATFAELNRTDRRDLSLPAGLTGENKPDGLSLRFRRYVPPNLPSFVPLKYNNLPLFIADETPEGWLAFYKGDCGGLGDVCQYEAALFAPDGEQAWSLGLNQFLQQRRFVEIQDIRLREGRLYFNEACATYSDEVDGACSYLVRVDPERAALEWRTPPLTSNNIFIFHGPYVISGYGFTAEPDALYLIDQESGRILTEADLDSAHEYLEVKDGVLHVVTYRSIYTFAFNP